MNDSIQLEGVVALPIEVNKYTHLKKLEIDFVVVDLVCLHNTILGRPYLEDLYTLNLHRTPLYETLDTHRGQNSVILLDDGPYLLFSSVQEDWGERHASSFNNWEGIQGGVQSEPIFELEEVVLNLEQAY